jgi:hypothetical protein
MIPVIIVVTLLMRPIVTLVRTLVVVVVVPVTLRRPLFVVARSVTPSQRHTAAPAPTTTHRAHLTILKIN